MKMVVRFSPHLTVYNDDAFLFSQWMMWVCILRSSSLSQRVEERRSPFFISLFIDMFIQRKINTNLKWFYAHYVVLPLIEIKIIIYFSYKMFWGYASLFFLNCISSQTFKLLAIVFIFMWYSRDNLKWLR